MMAFDQALAEPEVPRPDPGRWAGRLAEVARQLHVVISRHRDLFPCSIGPVNGFSLTETRTGEPERTGPDLSPEVNRCFASLPVTVPESGRGAGRIREDGF
jgi:hypothetical protein